MGYSVRLELDGGPPSNSAAGTHWRKRKKSKDMWQLRVRAALGTKIPAQPLQHALVVITRHSNKPLDGDNLHHGAKYLLDALTICGVIEDDSHAVIGMPDVRWQQYRHPGVKTTMSITECNEADLDMSAWEYEDGAD